MSTRSLLLVTATSLLVSSSARALPADPSPPAPSLSAWGIATWGDGYGGGVRYVQPLAPILPSGAREMLAVEFGVDVLSWNYAILSYDAYRWNEVRPTAGLSWRWRLNRAWTLYPRLDLAYAAGWHSGASDTWDYPRQRFSGLDFDLSLGALLHLDDRLSLVSEVGAVGLKIGASVAF